ncbi:hypothetical protein NEF87_001518 [Candidatus Lokiarchaeum ossiferum]|uniref:ABC transmembrane type-1 domain-containing protein n=1 Tax=Candidatus Lokiarchaeum ossiferum TaxID=2951803 RepID=A0ABY6HNZ1_9ARCH|nr:hypothetical protein NEF87_001518 [Candidatus Lokiarchaeum sp. B-35]
MKTQILGKNQGSTKKKADYNLIYNRFLVIFAFLAIGSFLLAFFYIPLSKIMRYAFVKDQTFSFSEFSEIFTSSLNLSAISFSIFQALLSSLICFLLGFPISFFMAKYTFPGKKLLLNIMTVPFVLPSIVVLLGFIVVYGENGWINTLWNIITENDFPLIKLFGSFQGILLAHVFYNISVVIRMLIPAWENIDYEQIEIARSLGANRFVCFFKIILPQIFNYILSSFLLIFTYCFNSFAIVLYLGEARFQTIEVRVYRLMTSSFDFSGGASLALLQLLINSLVIILYLFFEKKTRQMARGKNISFSKIAIQFSRKHWKNNLFLALFIIHVILVALFSILPILAVIIASFIPFKSGISIFWGYGQLFSFSPNSLLGTSPMRIILNTFWFASLTMIATLFFSLMIVFLLRNRYQKINNFQVSRADSLISFLIIIPMATSSITLAIGLFLQFQTSILFAGSVWIIIILAHVLISIPFTTRSILASYNRIDLDLLNIAATLGSSRIQIFRKIELPLIKNGLIVGAIFSFAISLGEFGATNFLARSEYGTLSIGISKLLFSRTLQLPASMATILIIITVLCFFFIHKIGDIDFKV